MSGGSLQSQTWLWAQNVIILPKALAQNRQNPVPSSCKSPQPKTAQAQTIPALFPHKSGDLPSETRCGPVHEDTRLVGCGGKGALRRNASSCCQGNPARRGWEIIHFLIKSSLCSVFYWQSADRHGDRARAAAGHCQPAGSRGCRVHSRGQRALRAGGGAPKRREWRLGPGIRPTRVALWWAVSWLSHSPG